MDKNIDTFENEEFNFLYTIKEKKMKYIFQLKMKT